MDQSRPRGHNEYWASLSKSAFAEMDENVRRVTLLTKAFPELRRRVAVALLKTGLSGEVSEIALRHPLSAEALAEVLEGYVENLPLPPEAPMGRLISEYSWRVAEKLLALESRPADELRRITATFPEVDLWFVRAALERKLISPEEAAAALEDSLEYKSLRRRVSAV